MSWSGNIQYIQARGRSSQICEGGMNQLTHQEQKIVALVAQGLTNKEIAQRLGSSPFTVRNQMKVIMRKLELKNRIQVAYLVGQQVNADLPCESFGKPIF